MTTTNAVPAGDSRASAAHEESATADALTYADQRAGRDGGRMSIAGRIAAPALGHCLDDLPDLRYLVAGTSELA